MVKRNWEQYYRNKCARLEADLTLIKKRLQRFADDINIESYGRRMPSYTPWREIWKKAR